MTLPSQVVPDTYEIDIIQGGTFSRTFEFLLDDVALDFTDATARSSVRENLSDTSSLIDFNVTIAAPTTGVVEISLTDTQTAALDVASNPDARRVKMGYWDLEIEDAAGVERYVQGMVYLSREATK